MEKEIFNTLSAILRTEGWQPSKYAFRPETTLIEILTDDGGVFSLRATTLATRILSQWGVSLYKEEPHERILLINGKMTLGELAESISKELQAKNAE